VRCKFYVLCSSQKTGAKNSPIAMATPSKNAKKILLCGFYVEKLKIGSSQGMDPDLGFCIT
jgi:hypothetical protein